MYAVIRTGGKQYRVQEGDELRIEKLTNAQGSEVVFDDVLMIGGAELKIGTPTVAGASVTAAVLSHERARKILIFKSRRRKGYRKRRGHRQTNTVIKINAITV